MMGGNVLAAIQIRPQGRAVVCVVVVGRRVVVVGGQRVVVVGGRPVSYTHLTLPTILRV